MYFYIFDKNPHSLKLIIDIGNTTAKLALFDGKELNKHKVVDSLTLKNVQQFVLLNKVSSAILSSVKNISKEFSEVINEFNAIVLSENTFLPIENNYATPSSLGKDRLAVVVGASFLYPNNDILVFDAGTCLTVDFINSSKEYIGGRISPGIEMRYKALHTFTDKLPLGQKEKTTPIISASFRTSVLWWKKAN